MQLELDPLLEDIDTDQKPRLEQLSFDFGDAPPTFWNSFTNTPILSVLPSKTITFSSGDSVCGTFSWEDGSFKFIGEAEKSAKVFTDYVCQFLDFKKQS